MPEDDAPNVKVDAFCMQCALFAFGGRGPGV